MAFKEVVTQVRRGDFGTRFPGLRGTHQRPQLAEFCRRRAPEKGVVGLLSVPTEWSGRNELSVQEHPEYVPRWRRACLRSPRGRAAVFAGWGWGARRGAQWIAQLSTSAATPQTTRKDHCPKGWSEIGPMNSKLWRLGCLHWHEPMQRIRSGQVHHDGAPKRSSARSQTDP